jgi:hypothetical protein
LPVAVCDAADSSPGCGAFSRLLDRLFGTAVGDLFRAPFGPGDAARLGRICEEGVSRTRRSHGATERSASPRSTPERAAAATAGSSVSDFSILIVSSVAVRPADR